MNRPIHRVALFATLLLWQLALATASHSSVVAAVSADAPIGVSAHCHVHSHLVVAQDATRTTADGVTRADASDINGKPACCAATVCKCGGVPASAATTSPGPAAVMAPPLHSPPAFDPLLIAQCASSPFRPPI